MALVIQMICVKCQPSTIDGITNPDDMCEMFASKYRILHSSVPSNDKDMTKKLNRNKSDGLNGPSPT